MNDSSPASIDRDRDDREDGSEPAAPAPSTDGPPAKEPSGGPGFGVGNSVLLKSAANETKDSACHALLSDVDPTEPNVLLVSLAAPVQSRIVDVIADLPYEPGTLYAIGVGLDDPDRIASGFPPWVSVDTISDVGDLQSLGILLSSTVSEFDDGEIVFCLDSITAILQYTESNRAYRFLHTLIHRFDTVDVRGHYHVDPSTVDESTLATLTPLFDTVFETFEDGTWMNDEMESPQPIPMPGSGGEDAS
jgi:hypothetical protein